MNPGRCASPISSFTSLAGYRLSIISRRLGHHATIPGVVLVYGLRPNNSYGDLAANLRLEC